MSKPTLLLFFFVLVSTCHALDNGLALTPPMGWLSWLRFGCTIDCKNHPTECISENLIKRTADAMVSEGYLEAGYQYVTIDDCWPEMQRGSDGRLVPDRQRFPSGMKALSRYVRSKGLKFGIYEDYGEKTCAGYPGVLGHEATDVATFADWEVDYVKLDGCGTPDYDTDEDIAKGFPMFGKLMNESGRPMLYSCCWRTNQKHLVIGNSGLTVNQARVQMAVWSILAAPLIMSVDLSTIKPEFKEILLNKDVIAVNQDRLGKQGLRIWIGDDKDQIWHRELLDGARALAFVNLGNNAVNASYTHEQMKLPLQDYILKDLYKEEEERSLRRGEDLKVKINATGVKFYKFTPKLSGEYSA